MNPHLNWQTLVFSDHDTAADTNYVLCFDDFDLCHVWRMPEDGVWHPGEWMMESMYDVEWADNLDAVIDIAEAEAQEMLRQPEALAYMREKGVQV